MPNFNQTVQAFSYDFDSVTLRGTNGWVRAADEVRSSSVSIEGMSEWAIDWSALSL